MITGASGRSVLVRVLAAAAPHQRGGRGSLGLHWMLSETPADFVAVVDLSRRRSWLVPAADFEVRAQPLPGRRFHLDWIVGERSGTSTPVPGEGEFESYVFARALARLAHDLR